MSYKGMHENPLGLVECPLWKHSYLVGQLDYSYTSVPM